VSTKENIMYILKNINGLVRIKISSFKEACNLNNIDLIKPNYNIGLYDTYFAGLIDSKGTIDLDYINNVIECNLTFKYNEYTAKLNFDKTLLNFSTPTIIVHGTNSKLNSRFISYKFQNEMKMLFIHDYFMSTGLYSERKFYKATKIKDFILIRKYKTFPLQSIERKIYSDFLKD
jgi:hypothetical protein